MKLEKISGQILLKNATIMDPYRDTVTKGDILVRNGKIAEVGKCTVEGKVKEIDCKGLIVTHGFFDMHAHFREPGREDKETLESGSHAAIAGGFTHVCVMPNTDPPLDTPESIRFIVEKAEGLPVKISPIGAVSKGLRGKEITEMGSMVEEGAVAFSDDGVPVHDSQVMRIALEYAGMFGVPIINHAEDISLRNDGLMNEGRISTRLGLAGNPDIAESTMVNRDLNIARMAKSAIHVPHVSSAKSVDVIKEFKKRGINVTAEVTPHHIYFNDEALTTFNTNLKVAPPIRDESTRKKLINGFKNGTIDCIATDHAPHTIEEKEGTFDLAPFGMIGLESCFGAVNRILVKQAGCNLMDVVKGMTVNPRKIMGFDTDLFKNGQQAEITVIDPEEDWVFSEKDIGSKSKNSPFIGEKLTGKVKLTMQGNWLCSLD